MKTISKEKAQRIASEWHCGQYSALYQFASSGELIARNGRTYAAELLPELEQFKRQIGRRTAIKEAEQLLRFFEKHVPAIKVAVREIDSPKWQLITLEEWEKREYSPFRQRDHVPHGYENLQEWVNVQNGEL